MSTACTELANWNLFVNEAKTDNVHIFLVNISETDDAGNMLQGNEKWRSSKTSGSLLCSTKDVQTRCILGYVAFRSFWKMWMRRPNIPLDKRMLVYNAMVIPFTLYNCSNWAVTTTLLHKLDVCHRSHRRSILGMHWPNGIISTEDLYVYCRSMFGHVLHMAEEYPAQLSLQFAVAGSNQYRGRVRRHTTNLLEMLHSNLKEKGVNLRSGRYLVSFRVMATDRTRWRRLWGGD